MNTRDVFGRDHVPVVTAAQAVQHDQVAQQEFGISERVLMENAGRALALVTHALYPTGSIVGVAGAGHNGGDTVIALRVLQSWGRDVSVLQASAREIETQLLHGASLNPISDDAVANTFAAASVILDGVLGTGARGAPRELAVQRIQQMNEAGKPIIAVDMPSGVDADTGAVYADVIRAHTTVTFGFPKIGLLLHPARGQCGRLIAVEIGFPPLPEPQAALITPQWAGAHLPRRPPTANKGTSGRLLLLAGSKGMAGAAVLAGSAAMRSGVGLVRIASAADNREIIQKAVPEAIFADRDSEFELNGITAIVAGPGMGAGERTRALLRRLFDATPDTPALLDADAINVFAGSIKEVAAIAAQRPLLITPHPKEFSRLTKTSLNEIVAHPVEQARRVANETGATVLLKGQPSVVAQRGEPLLINSVGSSDFAAAGMGDQLSGVIGAMLAAGLDPRTAAGVGLFYSGRAGDIAGLGRSLTPTDVTDHMARAFAQPGPVTPPFGLPFITFDQPPRW